MKGSVQQCVRNKSGMSSQEQRDLGEAWGLPQGELDGLCECLMQHLDVVCDAVRARLPANARDTLCSRSIELFVGHAEQLMLALSAAWWPTGDGGDDLLEIAYNVSWPRKIEADITIDCGATVTEWGSLFPYAEQRVRCTSAASRVVALAPALILLGRSLAGREGELADAIVTLKDHGGSWPASR
jgi:hypothetical protein